MCDRGSEEEIKINEPVLRVVILATGLHLTTDCWGNNTRDRRSDRDRQRETQRDAASWEDGKIKQTTDEGELSDTQCKT